MEYLLAAFTLGLLGSAHCVGMCGPIVLALPLSKSSWTKKLWGGILYNLGRTFTYGILGAVFGLFGQGLRLAGFQQWVSIVLGIIMILSVFFPMLFKKNNTFNRLIHGYSGRLFKKFGNHFKTGKLSSLLIIGLLNGLLPCGLVYIAVAGALDSGSISRGALFMISFGLGTTPLLYVLGIFSSTVSAKIKSGLHKVLPVIIVLVGIIFILRGSGLGIKYLSPPDKALEIKEEGSQNHSCH